MNKKQTILVVDDLVEFRYLVQNILEREGFAVITASSGQEGLDMYLRHQDDISLILTDVNCAEGAGLDGPKMAREIQTIERMSGCAKTPISFMTGGLGDYGPNELKELSPYPLLNKPFSPSDLLTHIQIMAASLVEIAQ